MSNHILGNEDLMKYLAIMNHKGKTHEFGNYRTPSRPGLYRLTSAGINLPVDLDKQLLVNVRTFFK